MPWGTTADPTHVSKYPWKMWKEMGIFNGDEWTFSLIDDIRPYSETTIWGFSQSLFSQARYKGLWICSWCWNSNDPNSRDYDMLKFHTYRPVTDKKDWVVRRNGSQAKIPRDVKGNVPIHSCPIFPEYAEPLPGVDLSKCYDI